MMTRPVAFAIGILFGTLLGVLIREAASHNDSAEAWRMGAGA